MYILKNFNTEIIGSKYILKTKDAGQSWQVVYENPTQGMFLDAMDFYDNQNGMVIGDPLDGKIFLARTNDFGDSWNQIDTKTYPNLSKGEACFASSGSNIVMLNKKKFAYITGGIQSNLYIGKKKIKLPIIQGKESTGANSLAVKNSSTWMVVGGDFLHKEEQIEHAVVTTNAGKSFSKPIEPPHGYRSCVQFLNVKTWISCGLNGVDITHIYQDVFNGKGLTSVTFDSETEITEIHARAFNNNNLTEVTIPDSVQKLDYAAFNNNPITKITIGPNVVFESNVFKNNNTFRDVYYAQGAGTYVYVNGVWVKQ